MKLIPATPDDVPRIMPCARAFCAVLGIALNEPHYEAFWRRQIASRAGAVFLVVDETGLVAGGIGAVACRLDLTGELELIEKFWFMDDKYRSGLWAVRLLKEIERWGDCAGCKNISMIYMEDSMREALEKFYQRFGYKRFETVYRKQIS